MYGELIPIVGVVFGVLLIGYTVGKITGLIRLWMEQRHERKYGHDVNQRLIHAFKEFKRNTEERLRNLEAAVSGETPEIEQSGESGRTIEIEEKERESTGDHDNNLRNMLKN